MTPIDQGSYCTTVTLCSTFKYHHQLHRHSHSLPSFPRRRESTTTVDLRLRGDRHKQQRGILAPASQGFANAMDSRLRGNDDGVWGNNVVRVNLKKVEHGTAVRTCCYALMFLTIASVTSPLTAGHKSRLITVVRNRFWYYLRSIFQVVPSRESNS